MEKRQQKEERARGMEGKAGVTYYCTWKTSDSTLYSTVLLYCMYFIVTVLPVCSIVISSHDLR